MDHLGRILKCLGRVLLRALKGLNRAIWGPSERRASMHIRVGSVRAGLNAQQAAHLQDELARAGSAAPRLEGRQTTLRSNESIRSVAAAVERVRAEHPEYDLDRWAWGLSMLQAACELVLSGATSRDIAVELKSRKREFMKRAYEADPPSRRRVFTFAAAAIFVVLFCLWALDKERHSTQDKGATRDFVYAVILAMLIPAALVLYSGFMARLQMAEPWVTVYRFLDNTRLSLSVGAGVATFAYVRGTSGGHGSTDFYRAAGDLIALLAIAIAVEARLSAAARERVPAVGILVLAGFAFIGYGEYTCLHVLVGRTPTRFEFAVVTAVLVGMGVALALLAVIGPTPFVRSSTAVALRPPPPTKAKKSDPDERAG